MGKKKNYDNYDYYQVIGMNGLEDVVEENKEKDKRSLYTFTGSIMYFDKCLVSNWTKSTMAVSEKQALNNITFAAKLKCNLEPSAKLKLVGQLVRKEY